MGNICIIGPTGAGKTTYLAGLAYWPEKTNPNFQITAITNDAKNLASKGKYYSEWCLFRTYHY